MGVCIDCVALGALGSGGGRAACATWVSCVGRRFVLFIYIYIFIHSEIGITNSINRSTTTNQGQTDL